jgi:hypothetical protein
VVPFQQAHLDMTLQHDNATSHALVLCVIYCKTGMSWPAKSPDLNPIARVG